MGNRLFDGFGSIKNHKQPRILLGVGIALVVLGTARLIIFTLAFATEFVEVTSGGVIFNEGFDYCCDTPLHVFRSWEYVFQTFFLPMPGGSLDLIAGIIGIINYKKPERAGRCLLWGIAAFSINVILIFTLYSGVVGLLLLPFHTLYIVTAYRLKKSWA